MHEVHINKMQGYRGPVQHALAALGMKPSCLPYKYMDTNKDIQRAWRGGGGGGHHVLAAFALSSHIIYLIHWFHVTVTATLLCWEVR